MNDGKAPCCGVILFYVPPAAAAAGAAKRRAAPPQPQPQCLLVTQRGNKLSFPKGKRESSESNLAAALRELSEESGVARKQIAFLRMRREAGNGGGGGGGGDRIYVEKRCADADKQDDEQDDSNDDEFASSICFVDEIKGSGNLSARYALAVWRAACDAAPAQLAPSDPDNDIVACEWIDCVNGKKLAQLKQSRRDALSAALEIFAAAREEAGSDGERQQKEATTVAELDESNSNDSMEVRRDDEEEVLSVDEDESSHLSRTYSVVEFGSSDAVENRSQQLKWPHLFFAGSSCVGYYTPMNVDTAFLRRRNVRCVISLEAAVGSAEQCAPLRAAGIHHCVEIVPDFHTPTIEQMQRIVQFIEENCASPDESDAKKKKEGVLVHCFAGMGRTGTVLACLLCYVNRQCDANEAVRRIRKQRPGSIETAKQAAFVNDWCEFLTSQSERQ